MKDTVNFVISVLGIYACFLSWGYLQERVTTTNYGDQGGEKFRCFFFLNFFQALSSALVAFLYLRLFFHKESLTLSLDLTLKYLQVAFTHTLASPLGYASLLHIDYPTLLLGKSCKLVPVVLMNVVLYQKRYPFYKYLSVGLVTLGVSWFMLSSTSSSRNSSQERQNSLWGLFLLSLNLMMDGATNATQDAIFAKHRVKGQHMMLFMNLFSAAYTMFYFVALEQGRLEWQEAWGFCQRHPAVLRDIGFFCLCGGVGQCFIFYALQTWGSLSLVTVTVTRKMMSMVLSVVLFGHHLSLRQWAGVGLVFGGIGLDAEMKASEKRKAVISLKAANSLKDKGESGKEKSQ